MSRTAKVFISHSRRNRSFVTHLDDVLVAHGIDTFRDARRIRDGAAWLEEIGEALHACDWFLLVLSPQAVASRWVRRELAHAVSDERYDGRIVPVWWRKTELPAAFWVVRGIQSSIRFGARRDRERAYRRLLALWDIAYDPERLAARR